MRLLVDLSEAEDALAELSGQLGHGAAGRAMRMAINDTMRKQRTKLRQGVRDEYNIPADKIKSIDFSPATDYNLEAKMRAGAKPIQLAYFKPVFVSSGYSVRGKYSSKKGFASKVGKGRKGGSGGVTVEIKKGERVNIPFAFMVGKFETPLVFARGRYQKKQGFVKGKPRFPISALTTASVYGASFGRQRLPKIAGDAQQDLAIKAQEYLTKMKEGILK